MESTYSHLKDSDHIREARDAFGLEVEEHESELTPEVCPRCGENPPGDARLCPWCGLGFVPDSKALLEDAEETVAESFREVDPDDTSAVKKVQKIDNLLEDPDVREELLNRIDG